MIQVTPTIRLSEGELEFHFIHTGGPGGQNVNKLASGVQLRFDAANSPSLTAEVRHRLMKLAGKRMTTEGVLVIDARRFRSQERNRRDALDRLLQLIRSAAKAPRARKRTRIPQKVRRLRREAKRRRSRLKKQRRRVSAEEF